MILSKPSYRTVLISILLLVTLISAQAQVAFDEHIVDGDYYDARWVDPVDMDHDGDIDLVACSLSESPDIVWYENLGGDEFAEHQITSDFFGAFYLDVADMDNDKDYDIVAVSFSGSKVGWWENDGQQNFVQHIVAEDYLVGTSCQIYDIDMDGDQDIFSRGPSRQVINR